MEVPQQLWRRVLSRMLQVTLREACITIAAIVAIVFISRGVWVRLSPAVRFVEYDLSSATDDVFLCPELALPPIVDVRVCLHTEEDDADFSPAVHYEGCWRRLETATFYRAMRREPDYGLIDIGAGLGIHTLIAASQGRPVLAVEPVPENVFRLHKSLQMGKMAARVRLLVNAVGDVSKPDVKLSWPEGHITSARVLPEGAQCDAEERCAQTNQITLDDLLPYIGFPAAYVKISTSGDEPTVLARAGRLFTHVRIPLVFMDFGVGKRICLGAANGSIPTTDPAVRSLGHAIHFLFEREYLPHHGATGELLDGTRCQTWPETTVIWEHLSFKGSYT